jgi:hypothetical protein
VPDHVEVLLGSNDICNRDCVDSAHCRDPVHRHAVARRRGPGSISSSPVALGSTDYLLGVPRVQDLREVGLAKSGSAGQSGAWVASVGSSRMAAR